MTATMPLERPTSRIAQIAADRSDRAHDQRRVDTLHDMLTRYNEARTETVGSGGGGSRLEARMLGFDSATFTPSYRELERCLDQLRWLAEHGRPMIEKGVSSAAAWWHLRSRYLDAQTVRHEVRMRKTHSGRRVPAPLPRNMEVVARPTILQGQAQYLQVRIWDARVDPAIVGAGLRWISGEFRGEPSSEWHVG